MLRLALIIHFVVASTLMGSAVVFVLVMGWTSPWPILGAALAGFLLAVPVSWLVAREMTKMVSPKRP